MSEDRGPYGPGQSLAEVLGSNPHPQEIELAIAVNLAAIAYELRTANLIAHDRATAGREDTGIRERLDLPDPVDPKNPWRIQ